MQYKTFYTILLFLTTGIAYSNAQALNCQGLPTISCGSVINGTNANTSNKFTKGSYNCITYEDSYNAPDVVYSLKIEVPGTYEFTLSGLSADLDLFMMKFLCTEVPTCILESSKPGNTSEKIGPLGFEAGQYYFIIDGYDASQISNFTFKASCGNSCSGVEELVCGQIYSKSTLNTTNKLTRSDYEGFVQSSNNFDGNDILFKYNHNELNRNANVVIWGFSGDLDMFLLKNCNRPVACLNSAENLNFNYEYIDFTGLPYGDYYIAVDGYNSAQKSSFNLLISCQNFCLLDWFAENIECGETKQGTTFNSRNIFSKYSCHDKYVFTGPERYYNFKAPADGKYIVDLTGFSNDLELFILNGDVNCKYNPVCLDKSTNMPGIAEQKAVDLKKDQSITIVVDGALGAYGPYQLKVSCPGTPIPKCMDCFQCFRWKKGGGENEVYFENSFCEEDYIGLNEAGGLRGAVSYDWDFAGENVSFLDGTNKSSQSPKCKFPRTGKFTVCFKVYQLGNLIFECCRTVFISPCQSGPVPRLTYTINESSGEVQFDASASSGAEGYDWDFGGGTSVVTHDTKPKRKYSPGKCYTVCLIVYNGCGSSKICITVCPGYAPCTSLSPNHPTVNLTLTDDRLQFSNISETFWDKIEWKLPQDVEFDQGSNAGSSNPRFKFKKPGSYIFCGIFYYKCHKICICWTYNYPGFAPVPKCMDCFQCFRWKKGGGENEVYFENSFCEEDYIGLNEAGGLRGAVSYEWDFAGENVSFLDGTNKSSQSPKCKFPRTGKFTVCFKVYQLGNLIFECCRTVFISPCQSGPIPRLNYTINESSGEVQFDASSSSGAEGYDWDFGGGTSVVTHDTKPKRKYSPGKCYTVCLLVYNGCGSSKICITVCPGYSPCTSLSPNHPSVNLTLSDDKLQFSNISETFWDKIEWKLPADVEFDQGSTSTTANPRFKFKKPGSYIFCAIIYYKCHKICICLTYYYPGMNPTPITCDKICPPLVTSYRDCHSFEEYTIGNISPQKANDRWILPAAATDGQIVNNPFKSGAKSLAIKSSALSTYYSVNQPLNHISRLEWQMYIPNGGQAGWDIRTAAFNFQLPYDLEYQNGLGSARSKSTAKDEIIGFSYPVNQWFRNVLLFNASDKTIELWINNKFINKITYELAAGAQDIIRELRFKNGSNGAVNSNYFVDDLCFSEVIVLITCQQHIDPVCVNGRTFNNECHAQAAGYSELEWTKGACAPSVQKLTFDIDDNVCDAKGNKIIVPVRVTNFKSIRNFSMTIQVADKGIASISAITSTALTEMSSLEIDPGKTYAIILNSIHSVSLADGAIAFNIELNLTGNVGQSTALSILSIPVEIKAAALINNGTAIVPVEVKNGSACIMNTSFQLGGVVKNRKNEGIQNAGVTLTGTSNISTTTNQNGQYTFSGLNNGAYTIGVKKLNNAKNGVDIFDLAALQDHIITRSIITDPYKLLAADVNSDGEIDIFDLAELQDIIITRKPNFSGDQSWKFIPTSETLTAAKVKSKSFLTTRTADANTTDKTNLDFYGVKTGDLAEGVANPKDIIQTEVQLGYKMESRGAGSFGLKMPTIRARKNDIVFLPVQLESFKNIRVFQFELKWNPSALKLEGIQDLINGLNGFTVNNVLYSEATPGKLNFLWINPENQNLADHTILCKLKFKVLANSGETTTIEFVDVKAGEVQGSIPISSITHGTVNVGDVTTKLKRAEFEYVRFDLFPNPATDRITIVSREIFELRHIIDLFGKKYNLQEKGRNSYEIDVRHFSPGIYFIQTWKKGVTHYHKFIVQK